ncbi:hypothetical protein CL648_02050 [bacterium]|nr:hypothetical protein [bacterium]|tara:strand:+ start:6490 stop:6888 length:399 start_codon:yes stop_codon:yes gene_type:complete
MRKVLVLLSLTGFLTLNSFGFATILHSISGGDAIRFNSNVDNVAVYIDGQPVGKIKGGSLVYKISRDGMNKQVIFEKSGYKTENFSIGTKTAGAFWGNLITGGTVGSSTDSWSTKNSRQYTPNQFYVEMEKI